ncbi:MAG: TetR/AcrR family transcriptional regulator [Desulfobacteraceae bacterium]|nr:TetR/AcrR family transcriptional regulator [Desulfobacteraceae bacterium]
MGRKTAIIDTATRLFAEKGFADTATAEIAEKAGVAHGTLFYHFKNKQGILREIFTRSGSAYLEELRKTIAGQKTGMEQIEAALRFNEEYSRDHSQQILIFLRIFPDQLKEESHSPERQFIESIQQEVIAILRKSLDAGISDGTIECGDTEETARVLNSLIFGITHIKLMTRENTPSLTRSATDFCRRALAP